MVSFSFSIEKKGMKKSTKLIQIIIYPFKNQYEYKYIYIYFGLKVDTVLQIYMFNLNKNVVI